MSCCGCAAGTGEYEAASAMATFEVVTGEPSPACVHAAAVAYPHVGAHAVSVLGKDDVVTAACSLATKTAAPPADVEVPRKTKRTAYGDVPVVCIARAAAAAGALAPPTSARRDAEHALVAALACTMPAVMTSTKAETFAGVPASIFTALRGRPARME